MVRSFCTALKPPASPAAERSFGGRAASGRSRLGRSQRSRIAPPDQRKGPLRTLTSDQSAPKRDSSLVTPFADAAAGARPRSNGAPYSRKPRCGTKSLLRAFPQVHSVRPASISCAAITRRLSICFAWSM